MAYGDSKDSARRTASDKILRDKAFNIARNGDLHLWFTNFLVKIPQAVVLISIQIMSILWT